MTVAASAPQARPKLAVAFAGGLLAVGAVAFLFTDHGNLAQPAFFVLLLASIVSNLLDDGETGGISVSAAYLASVIAMAFLGPASAFAVPVVSELTVYAFDRVRWRALLINLAGAGTPTVLVAIAFQALDLRVGSAGFYAALAVSTAPDPDR